MKKRLLLVHFLMLLLTFGAGAPVSFANITLDPVYDQDSLAFLNEIEFMPDEVRAKFADAVNKTEHLGVTFGDDGRSYHFYVEKNIVATIHVRELLERESSFCGELLRHYERDYSFESQSPSRNFSFLPENALPFLQALLSMSLAKWQEYLSFAQIPFHRIEGKGSIELAEMRLEPGSQRSSFVFRSRILGPSILGPRLLEPRDTSQYRMKLTIRAEADSTLRRLSTKVRRVSICEELNEVFIFK